MIFDAIQDELNWLRYFDAIQDELNWLRYFYDHARHAMGPASDDIYHTIKESYTDDGGELPLKYQEVNE